MKEIDLLAFGAHPDDVEIGAGGIIAKHAANGLRVVICDLTEAELSSNGTVETRRLEAREAAKQLGIYDRINLGLPDRGLTGTEESIRKITQVIRQYRPKIVLAPYYEDRHPDHEACSRLVREAVFNAGIAQYITPAHSSAHRVHRLWYYFIHQVVTPSVIVDISEVYERKKEALLSYKSQFGQGKIQTPINQPSFLQMIMGRDQGWGHQIGVSHGEGVFSPQPLAQSLLV